MKVSLSFVIELIKASNYTEFPPRLPEQPIFYPVLNQEYAIKIAKDWNVPASGSGFVTQFEVNSNYLANFDIQTVGGSICKEYWIPAEELAKFNQNIVGKIEVVNEYYYSREKS